MKFVIATADPDQLEAIKARFQNRFADEAEVIAVDNALYALTVCEQAPPTLIVSGAALADMSGFEFYELVREDMNFIAMPFILLDSAQQASTRFMPIDAVLATDAHPADVLRVTFKLMTQTGTFDDTRSQNRTELRRFRPTGPIKAEGTLEVLTLFDLTLSLSQGKQSGKLYVLLGETESAMLFVEGQLVGAAIEGLSSEAAVMRIFRLAQDRPDAEFYFEASDQLPHSSFQTIDMPISELLLKIAISLDGQRAPASG